MRGGGPGASHPSQKALPSKGNQQNLDGIKRRMSDRNAGTKRFDQWGQRAAICRESVCQRPCFLQGKKRTGNHRRRAEEKEVSLGGCEPELSRQGFLMRPTVRIDEKKKGFFIRREGGIARGSVKRKFHKKNRSLRGIPSTEGPPAKISAEPTAAEEEKNTRRRYPVPASSRDKKSLLTGRNAGRQKEGERAPACSNGLGDREKCPPGKTGGGKKKPPLGQRKLSVEKLF